MRVAVEEPKLEKLTEARDDADADEPLHVELLLDGRRVRAADTVDPLHHEGLRPAEVLTHPRDLHVGVSLEVGIELLDVAHLLSVVELLKELLPKLVDDELGVAAEAVDGEPVEVPGEPPENVEVAVDEGLHAGAPHLDGDVLPCVPELCFVDLPEACSGDGRLADAAEDLRQGPPEVRLHDRERLRVGEGGHVVLQDAELFHEVLADDVGAVREHLARLDEGRAEVGKRLPQLRRADPDLRLIVLKGPELVEKEASEEGAERGGDVCDARRTLEVVARPLDGVSSDRVRRVAGCQHAHPLLLLEWPQCLVCPHCVGH
mmetsp:Transcript_20634/g.49119  ORF Transcript_20634/g.49119 Transcript_20634/m.49119 type:complete len:318 (+) Transcript_20634:1184-2137(+)